MSDVDTLAEAADKMLDARTLVKTLDDEFLLYLIDMALLQLGKVIAQKIRGGDAGDAFAETH